MFTCFIKYKVEPNKIEELIEYANSWIDLIEEYGGTHHGYFIPPQKGQNVPDPTFSFPGLGEEGEKDIAVALFSFPDLNSYNSYKTNVAKDERCIEATKKFKASPCFSGYERNFLIPVRK